MLILVVSRRAACVSPLPSSAKRGAIIPMLRMSADECSELAPLRELLASAAWPPRNIEENLATYVLNWPPMRGV